MDALRSRFRAIREYMPQLRELGVAILLDQLGHAVAAAPAAALALDRQGGDEEVRERVRVIAHGAIGLRAWRASFWRQLWRKFCGLLAFSRGRLAALAS